MFEIIPILTATNTVFSSTFFLAIVYYLLNQCHSHLMNLEYSQVLKNPEPKTTIMLEDKIHGEVKVFLLSQRGHVHFPGPLAGLIHKSSALFSIFLYLLILNLWRRG